MKKFIKAVVVASVLVSANSAFATYVPAGGTKPAVSGAGGTSCPMKANMLLHANTSGIPDTASAPTNVQVQNGKTVQ